MSNANTDPRFFVRASFPHMISERIRFRDIDWLGHVNNAVFSTLSETARTLWLMAGEAPPLPSRAGYVIVRMLINFRQEIAWPSTVEVGTGVLGVGRSSFTVAQSIFNGDDCAATMENVIVVTDRNTRKSMEIPADVRAWLNGMQLRNA